MTAAISILSSSVSAEESQSKMDVHRIDHVILSSLRIDLKEEYIII